MRQAKLWSLVLIACLLLLVALSTAEAKKGGNGGKGKQQPLQVTFTDLFDPSSGDQIGMGSDEGGTYYHETGGVDALHYPGKNIILGLDRDGNRTIYLDLSVCVGGPCTEPFTTSRVTGVFQTTSDLATMAEGDTGWVRADFAFGALDPLHNFEPRAFRLFFRTDLGTDCEGARELFGSHPTADTWTLSGDPATVACLKVVDRGKKKRPELRGYYLVPLELMFETLGSP